MSDDTNTTATTPRETAFADAAEALQTIATGSMALLSAICNLIEDVSKKNTVADASKAADATEVKANAAPATKSAPTTAPDLKPEPIKPASTKPTPTITPDDITKACVTLIKHDRANSQRIQALLQTYGVSQMSALDASKYEAFMADLTALEG